MQLKLTRSQRESGVIASSVIFCLDARAELTSQEQANVLRYKLGNQVIYNSEASKRHLEKSERQNDGSIAGGFKALASAAIAAMKLNITVQSLQRGQHIECKDLNEVIATENALYTACENLRDYLTTAATFDGRETIMDFSGSEPVAIAPDPSAVVSAPTFPAPSPDTPPALAYETPTAQTFASPFARQDTATSANPFDEYAEKFKHWWAYRSSGQRIFFVIAVLFVLYIIVKAI